MKFDLLGGQRVDSKMVGGAIDPNRCQPAGTLPIYIYIWPEKVLLEKDQVHQFNMIYNVPSGKLHSNGKWTLWRCISYWKWWYSIAMLVYWRVSFLKLSELDLSTKDLRTCSELMFLFDGIFRMGSRSCVLLTLLYHQSQCWNTSMEDV